MSKKIYISGKITGLSEKVAKKQFSDAQTQLKGMYPGCETINPMEVQHDHDQSWLNFMKQDIKAMMDCNAIFMLKNWQESKGAIVEYTLAKGLGYEIIHQA